ncbi:sulfate adenylyltransferase subunit 1 [Agilicoccus flavus]|uniref:sulfate adenylyltransferase subunit 1 n=1 Tax=Agilicoccus flavus TaxID=2775968 RepID=UPI001CF6DD44|nr:GTP-binding protein [Agilicoccus flavus]
MTTTTGTGVDETTEAEREAAAEVLAAARSELRLVVAGSVDDGKSTLVGRLLFDTKSILADTYESITDASRRRGSEDVDLALLTDGLRAEREQGITIDVAYRYFSTPRRSFVLADTPGHTQYTRNTVTGASTAQAAVVLVDVRHGVSVQTRRHLAVMALLRVPSVIVAVNKMDAQAWSRARFDEVAADVRAVARNVGLPEIDVVPVSALTGQNVVDGGGERHDAAGDWYSGATLLELLEGIDVTSRAAHEPFRMPVQLVIRPRTPEHPDYRGLAGRIAAGTLRVGDVVRALPGGTTSTVTGLDTPAGPAQEAAAGESVTVLLSDEVDVGRGQVLVHADGERQPRVLDSLDGVVCWLSEKPSTPNQRVLVKAGTKVVRAMLTTSGQAWDVDAQDWVASDEQAQLNDIVRVGVRLAESVAVDEYTDDRHTGGFLVIDAAGGATLAAGMVGNPLTGRFDPSI